MFIYDYLPGWLQRIQSDGLFRTSLKNMAVAVGFIVPIKRILHELRSYLLCRLHGRESVLELYWLR